MVLYNRPQNALFLWSFTIKKDQIKNEEHLRSIFDPICKKYAFALEKGGKEDYEHYQGVVSLITKTQALHKVFAEDVDHSQFYACAAHSSSALNDYVRKTIDDGNKLITQERKLNYVQIQSTNLERERWMIEAIYYLEYLYKFGDGRKILWCYSECGGVGKTKFLRILDSHTWDDNVIVRLLPRGSHQSMLTSTVSLMNEAYVNRSKLIVAIPLARNDTFTQPNHSDSKLLAAVMEMIVDGVGSATMYGKAVQVFLQHNTSIPVVLSNSPPTVGEQLSYDRITTLRIYKHKNKVKHAWQIL